MAIQRITWWSMVLRGFIIFIGLIVVSSCSNDNVQSSEKDEVNPGKALYNERCVQCHGYDGKDCLAGAADLSISKMDDDSIQLLIVNGKNAMPPKPP